MFAFHVIHSRNIHVLVVGMVIPKSQQSKSSKYIGLFLRLLIALI